MKRLDNVTTKLRLNQTFIQPNTNVAKTFPVTWVVQSSCRSGNQCHIRHYNNGLYRTFITDSFFLLPSKKAIHEGHGKTGIFGREHLSFRMLTLVRF